MKDLVFIRCSNLLPDPFLRFLLEKSIPPATSTPSEQPIIVTSQGQPSFSWRRHRCSKALEYRTKALRVTNLLRGKETYCWWTKSQTTTWDVWNPMNNGIFTISTGAGFCPSTVPSLKLTGCTFSKGPFYIFQASIFRWNMFSLKEGNTPVSWWHVDFATFYFVQ